MSKSDPIFTFTIVCQAMVAFIGLIFNGYILFVLICSKLTVNNILLLFMALADTAICLLILVANTPMSLNHHLPQVQHLSINSSQVMDEYNVQDWACGAQGALWTVLPLCITWAICGLIVDRYIAIVRPLSYNRLINVRKATVLLIIIWMCLISFSLPPLLGCCSYRFLLSHSGCVAICSRSTINNNEFYYMILYISSLLIPVIVIIVCNVHIAFIAHNHRHRIVSAIYEITMRAQATVIHQSTVTHQSTHQSSPNYLFKYKGRHAFLPILQLVGSLVIFIFPYYIIYAYKSFSNKPYDDYWTSTSTLILSFTPIVNGYVYGVKSKALRKTFKRLLQRYLYEQQASIEIDRRLSLRSQSSLREGWNSLLITSSLSSQVMYRSQRRFSAPISCTPVVVLTNNNHKLPERRQSLQNIIVCDTQTKTKSTTCPPLTKRPSFLAETRLTSATPLSPIQEISHFSDNSSGVINYE
ncbi:G-protein coupled receptor 26-like [Oppia nitens]|uniref:G-protein coupled receptor 26-like n=1 Tax=Oppia nitens TaxID=1686743 RepID=UPI0023DA0FD0|nr:G-protein coupled receptor 26-like [Oppia nitens]